MKLVQIAFSIILIAGMSNNCHSDPPLPDLPTVNQALTLKAALAISATDNIAVQQSSANSATASAAVRTEKAQSSPSLSANTYALNGDSNNIVTSPPGVSPPNIVGVRPHGFLDQNVTLMAQIFTGGKLAGQISSAQELYQSANDMVKAAQLDVQQAVTKSYVQTLLDQSLIDVAKMRLTAEKEQVRVTQERVTDGMAAPIDLLREQAEQANAQQELVSAQTEAEIALVNLKTTLGISQESNIALSDTLDGLVQCVSAPQTLADSIELAEERRPDLASALKQIEAADENLRQAKSVYSPQVYAIGMADEMSETGSDGHIGYTVGLTASIPLYDGGGREAAVDSAKSAYVKATLNAQSVRQTVDQDVATAWLNNNVAATEVQAAQVGVTAAQQAYDLADLRYNAGKSVAADRLDALSALTRAKGDFANATTAAIEAHVRLLTSMGLRL